MALCAVCNSEVWPQFHIYSSLQFSSFEVRPKIVGLGSIDASPEEEGHTLGYGLITSAAVGLVTSHFFFITLQSN